MRREVNHTWNQDHLEDHVRVQEMLPVYEVGIIFRKGIKHGQW